MRHTLIEESQRMPAGDCRRPDVVSQLRQLYVDLNRISYRDPEQELSGVAVSVVDHVFATARATLERGGSPSLDFAPELISPEALEAAVPVRAIDALVVTGQILAAFGEPPLR